MWGGFILIFVVFELCGSGTQAFCIPGKCCTTPLLKAAKYLNTVLCFFCFGGRLYAFSPPVDHNCYAPLLLPVEVSEGSFLREMFE